MQLSFDSIASQFDHQRGLPREALQGWLELINNLLNESSARIIEPGIGTGRLALPLAVSGYEIVGTDISRQMLNRCAESAHDLRISHRLSLFESDATDLPFGEHEFDLGIIAQLLYLVPDWPSVLDELARVIRPGGYVIHLTEPTTEGHALATWSNTWRGMIESTGYRHVQIAPDDTEVHTEFLRRWPDVQVRELARWGFGQTVAEAMEGYADRLRPLYTTVPDTAFDCAVADFLAWANENFPDGQTRLDGNVTLTAMIAAV